jgi:hypothetical protein
MAGRERKVALDGARGRTPKSAGFRTNPREHAGTGAIRQEKTPTAIRQEKTPTDNSWGFDIGGGWLTETGWARSASEGRYYP